MSIKRYKPDELIIIINAKCEVKQSHWFIYRTIFLMSL